MPGLSVTPGPNLRHHLQTNKIAADVEPTAERVPWEHPDKLRLGKSSACPGFLFVSSPFPPSSPVASLLSGFLGGQDGKIRLERTFCIWKGKNLMSDLEESPYPTPQCICQSQEVWRDPQRHKPRRRQVLPWLWGCGVLEDARRRDTSGRKGAGFQQHKNPLCPGGVVSAEEPLNPLCIVLLKGKKGITRSSCLFT